MIFGVTGHRSAGQKPGELQDFARLIAARMIDDGCTELISGMAWGWDLAITEALVERDIPFIAALPFPDQTAGWTDRDKARYEALLPKAKSVWYSGRTSLNEFYHVRDKLIVKTCAKLWALNSGRRSGTNSTVLYAEKIGCNTVNLWADWLAFKQEKVA